MNFIKKIKQIINQLGGMGYNIANEDLINVVLNVFLSKYYFYYQFGVVDLIS
jgi:hypothetical protein